MQAVSDNLIHFLDKQHKESPYQQFDIFKSIINNGLRLGKIEIHFGSNHDFISNNVVCFTDIPLSLCDEHTAIYGKFGIGFKKSSIKMCGGNPARYFINNPSHEGELIDHSTAIYNNLRFHFKLIQKLNGLLNNDPEYALYDKQGQEIINNGILKEWLGRQKTILSFEKEMSDLETVKNETDGIDRFYKEREWRLVPLVGNVNAGSMSFNQSEGFYYYKFNRNDINVVVTPNDEIRSGVLRFFLELERHADDRLKEFVENPPPIITYDDLHNW